KPKRPRPLLRSRMILRHPALLCMRTGAWEIIPEAGEGVNQEFIERVARLAGDAGVCTPDSF
ncbi:MAG TPA: hypothetical protein VK654_05590, partial [Nitrospirota bacterium]|nr:hypothetical protein [Nitrospirota bacterium]